MRKFGRMVFGKLEGIDIGQSSSEDISDMKEGLVGVRAVGIERVELKQ